MSTSDALIDNPGDSSSSPNEYESYLKDEEGDCIRDNDDDGDDDGYNVDDEDEGNCSKDEEKSESEEDETENVSNEGLIHNSTQTVMRVGTPRNPRGIHTNTNIITPRIKPKKRKFVFMNWKKYHKLDVVYRFLDDLEKDNPALCTVSVIGKSVEGRDIRMIKISNSDATNTGIWVDGGIHSREWISTSVVTFIANQLAKQFRSLPSYVQNKDWFLVPILNPDGYEYSHSKDRMWRKNKACYGKKCYGVDLNRNFSFGWGNNGEEGSSDMPESAFYRGPKPFSEPESAAVRDTIMTANTNFKVFLSFHSYFQSIIFPWGYKQDPCPDYFKLLDGGILMARAIYNTSGMTYKVGSTKDLTYYACGTSTDWSYGIAKIPFSYMVELRSRKYKFKLPRDQIRETCDENWIAVQSLLEYVDKCDK